MTSGLLTFAGLLVAATATPGPNVILVMSNAIRYGWRPACLTIAGNIANLLLVTTLCAFAIDATLASVPSLIGILRTGGGLYLIYLGARLWQRARHVPAQSGNPPITGTSPCPRRLFGEGFAVSFSNPNVFIFMAAVLPQVLAEGADFTSQLLTLLGTMIVTVGLLHLSYALLAAAFGAWLEAESRQRAVQRIAGALFILLGLKATLLS